MAPGSKVAKERGGGPPMRTSESCRAERLRHRGSAVSLTCVGRGGRGGRAWM